MTTHTPGQTPQDKLAAWAAMNGPDILTETVSAHGALLTRLQTDVRAARDEAAEVALGLGAATGAAIRAHEEEHHDGDSELVRESQILDTKPIRELREEIGRRLRAHDEIAHNNNVGDWLQGLDEQVSRLRGQLTDLKEEVAKLWAVWAEHELRTHP